MNIETQSFTLDDFAQRDSIIHRMDARVKLLLTTVFIVVVLSFPRYEITALAPLLLFPLSLAALTHIPGRFLLRRICIAAPFLLLIGVWNPVFDQTPVTFGGMSISGGWVSFASLVLRFVLTLAALIVLVASTGMFRLSAALEQLGAPRVFTVQLALLYRYFSVLTDEALRIWRSIEFRSFGTRGLSIREYGAVVGHLLFRSLDRGQRIHWAMLARGFDGQMSADTKRPVRRADLIFALTWIAFFEIARTWNLSLLLGELVTKGW